jgi:hypothetical protein
MGKMDQTQAREQQVQMTLSFSGKFCVRVFQLLKLVAHSVLQGLQLKIVQCL